MRRKYKIKSRLRKQNKNNKINGARRYEKTKLSIEHSGENLQKKMKISISSVRTLTKIKLSIDRGRKYTTKKCSQENTWQRNEEKYIREKT